MNHRVSGTTMVMFGYLMVVGVVVGILICWAT